MSLVRRIVDILVERFVASAGSMFAARMETVAALMHAEQQDELEQRARLFEAEGKMDLATDLRARASQLASVTPGASSHEVDRQLQHEQVDTEKPRSAQPIAGDDTRTNERPAELTIRRPARGRCYRHDKTD